MNIEEDLKTEFIALVGTPNSGKTTLFNWLTGRRQKVVNYPGSTVDISVGPLLASLAAPLTADAGVLVTMIDTPGTYSLFAKSQDEEVTVRALFDKQYNIRKVVVVLDSTQIARQVHLVRQLQESGFAVVVAVTMHDLHLKENAEVNLQRLTVLLGAPVCAIDGVLGGGVNELAGKMCALSVKDGLPRMPAHWSLEKMQDVFKEGVKIASEVTVKELSVFSRTEDRDRIFLHPFFGPVIFVIVMLALFSSIYWLAAPLMGFVDSAFGWLIAIVATALSNSAGYGLMGDFFANGVIAGLGAVLIFVPQIFILFIGISILEDSGYLARAATLVDKPLSKLGLNGKAFVPLLSGFACAVPAMMAARSINSPKERWLAMFIIPFMTCSARLPVYALLLSFLFTDNPFLAGLFLALLYVGAIVIGALASALLNKIVKVRSSSFFLLELPIYRRPQWRVVLRNSTKRTRAYVVKTGPIILFLSMLLWVLSTFPNYSEQNEATRMQSSYASLLGTKLEPIFKPMGVDWRVGVGLISAFAAREVFVSSLAVMFNVTGDDETLREGLLSQMRAATFSDGTPVFTVASVSALLVFFMLALQCMSTVATAKQEMRSWSFATVQLITMNILAYMVAVVTYRIMS